MKPENSITLYKTDDGQTALEVRIQTDTVWLNLNQIAELFKRDKSVISRHLRNIFKENELEKSSTVAFFATVQKEGGVEKTRDVEFFNLDVIISVGYRVNSKRGTQFRIWANKVLKEYLIQGYVINENRLKSQAAKVKELEKAVSMLSSIIGRKQLSADEATGLLKVITDYTYALDILDRYDRKELKIEGTSGKGTFQLNYEEAVSAIAALGKQMGNAGLFGKQKDDSLKSSLNTIYQTFDGRELYPSIEEKAANLLYFVVKNHSFIDGNKRIAAFLFLWFLEKNSILYRPDNSRRLSDNALVALTLLIAESRPEERDTIVKVVVNLINKKN